MLPMKTRTLGLVAVLTALLTAAPAGAQQGWVVAPAQRGWIGVSFEIQTTQQDGRTVETVTRITDVMHGSPAHAAGIRTGDVLLTANGREWAEGFADIIQGLRPGDPLRLVLNRDGRRVTVDLKAGARPAEALSLPSWTVTVTADSMVDRLYKAMDSLRLRITEDEGMFRIATGRMLADSTVWNTRDGNRLLVRLREGEPGRVVTLEPFALPGGGNSAVTLHRTPGVSEVRAPFGFYVFRGPTHDSLRAVMNELNQDIRELRSQQAARVRELARTASGQAARIDTNDPQLRRLEAELTARGREAEELRRAMEVAARREARDQERIAVMRVRGDDPPTAEAEVVGLRPLAPYVLGANRAAGAEVVDLQPELAEYFQVEGGVLVVDVSPNTPAAVAGIQPGDVLTRIGGEPVRSISDLRRGMAVAGHELPVVLVRKGRSLQVLLRR